MREAVLIGKTEEVEKTIHSGNIKMPLNLTGAGTDYINFAVAHQKNSLNLLFELNFRAREPLDEAHLDGAGSWSASYFIMIFACTENCYNPF